MAHVSTIEIYDIQKSKLGYLVEFSTETSSVSLDLHRSQLIDFIVDERLNIIDLDGEEWALNAQTFLDDNYFAVVSGYVEGLSNEN